MTKTSSIQQSVETLLGLLKPSYKVIKKDEYGITLESKNKSHTARLGSSGVTFAHPTNRDMRWVYGYGMMQEIRDFLRNTPSFDEQQFVQKQAEINSQKPRWQQQGNKKDQGPKGPSVRGTIIKMLGEKKSFEEILTAVKVLRPDRDEKRLKGEIYSTRAVFNKKNK